MLTIFSFPNTNIKQILDASIVYSQPEEAGADYINSEFTKRVSEKIKNSVKSQYGIESEVTVVTNENYNGMSIWIIPDSKIDTFELRQYVINNFCTQNDEVIVVGKET